MNRKIHLHSFEFAMPAYLHSTLTGSNRDQQEGLMSVSSPQRCEDVGALFMI